MTTGVGAALTADHYRQQAALRAQAVRDSAALWRHFSPSDRTSWERMVALAKPIVQARHAQSAALAARYYEQFVALERNRHERVHPVTPLDEGHIERSLAVTGLVGVIVAKSRGFSPQAAMQTGFVRFSGGLSRLALTGGRETIVGAVAASTTVKGYRRVTSGDPCAFCADLTGERSGADAFEAHDHCSCTAEPTF